MSQRMTEAIELPGGKPVPWLVLSVAILATAGAAVAAEPPAIVDDGASSAAEQDKGGELLLERFGEELEAVRRSASTTDDGTLAERVFLSAKVHVDDRAYVAAALRVVSELASRSPDHQDLAYAAEKTLWKAGFVSASAFARRAAALGPRVLGQLDAESGAAWLAAVWTEDVMQLADNRLRCNDVDGALSVLSTLHRAAADRALQVPAAVTSNVAGLNELSRVREGAGAGASPDAGSIYLAVRLVLADASLEDIATALSGTGVPAAAQVAGLVGGARTKPVSLAGRSRLLTAIDSLGLPSLVRNTFTEHLAARLKTPSERIAEQGFFGVDLSGRRRIVFVVDHSGSMTPRRNMAMQELKATLGKLTPSQEFHIVFFNTDATPMPPPAPCPATDPNRSRAAAFIDGVGSGGGTNPTKALQVAFAARPDVIILLTDGEFDTQIGDVVRDLNTGRSVRVDAVCISSTSGAAVLEQIAQENSGSFHRVTTPP